MPAPRVYAFAEPENDGERRVIRFLDQHVPSTYRIYHTMERLSAGQTYEWDVLVLAPHAFYALEVKDWPGRIVGNDREWLLSTGAVRKNPYPLIAKKARILKNRLSEQDARFQLAWVEPIVVIADDRTKLELTGDCSAYTVTLADVIARLTTPPSSRAPVDLSGLFADAHTILTADFRPIANARIVQQFKLEEQLAATDLYTEWRAVNRFAPNAPKVRLKIYAPDPYVAKPVRDEQLLLVKRDFEAAARLGNHPNVLGARDFFPDEGGRFILVLDDPAGVSLAAQLIGKAPLTFEAKARVMEDVASGLAAAHAVGVVHRNVTPENIWVTPNGAVLTNFDCARLPNAGTVHRLIAADLDPHYLAPEVQADPGAASAASDVYALGRVAYELLTGGFPTGMAPPVAPSAIDPLIPKELDELILRMLAREPSQRPAAEDVSVALATQREARNAPTGPAGTKPVPGTDTSTYDVGTIIDRQYLVRGVLGEGAFGRVYRVYSIPMDREFALKEFSRRDLALEDVQHEFHVLEQLQHPRIARVQHAGLLRQGTYFLLTEYINGTPLSALSGSKRPSPGEALRLIRDLLGALAYLHSRQYVHRDIKPSNLVVTRSGAYLIDFNIAAHAGSPRTSNAGTPLYVPPDIAVCELSPSRDLFAAGAILYELLTGRRPYGNDAPFVVGIPRDPLADEPRLAPAMAALLRRAVAPGAAERFASADEFVASLGAIEEPLLPPPPDFPLVEGITISPEERVRPNYNPYLTRFLTLYSQNRRDNSGTRGYDEISRATYVRTRLDKHLGPDILEGHFRLVVITGNAGDGKTAFIQNLEEQVEAGRAGRQGKVERLPSGNGSVIALGGRTIRTNYDGSQDEGQEQNDDVLELFFAPFRGTESEVAGRSDGETRLIAINEGKLLDFLHRCRDRFPWLAVAVQRFFDAGVPLPLGYAVVNLNDRAVVAQAGDSPSILARQLRALCDPVFWRPCDDCIFKDRCPTLFNVQTVNDPDLGSRLVERLSRMFEIAHLRGRMHLTMRSVRSALAYVLFGEETCKEIGKRLTEPDGGADEDAALLRRFYYNAIAAVEPGDEWSDVGQERDRLLRLLAEADVGLGANPTDDRELYARGTGSPLLPTASARSDYDREVLRAVAERLREAPPTDPSVAAEQRRLHAMLRRKAFFERPDAAWETMLPYSVLDEIILACWGDEAVLADLKQTIIRGLNRGEGVGGIDDALLLRVARGVPARVRSFRRFPAEEFELKPLALLGSERYVEFMPAGLELRYRPTGNGAHPGPTLRLGLDLIELLARMARGSAPTAAENRGPLVNVLVFRSMLANERYDHLLLFDTVEDRRFRVEQNNGRIALVLEGPADRAH